MNVFVAIGAVVCALGLFVTLVAPDTANGFLDGLAREAGPRDDFPLSQRLVYVAAFVATLSTWWILNRLRRMLLAVNRGDAFEPANVGRLQGVGLGLIGVQVSAFVLAMTVPEGVPGEADYAFDLGAWLGILVVFILAEVFRQGSAMRDEQQMTV